MNRKFQLHGYNPLRGLTEPILVSMLDEGDRGAYARLQWLYRFIEKRNATARAVKRRLLSALGGLDWDIRLVETDIPDERAAAERQADTLRDAYDRLENLRAALKHLALAELRGFAHLEKIYAPDWSIVELRVVEQWFWVRDGVYSPWQYNRTAAQGVTRGERVDLGKFIIREVDDPADEIISRCHVRMETSDADWDGYLEDYGVPPMFIVGPPNIPPEKEAEYQATAELAVSRARGYLPNGATLSTPSAGGSGGAGIFAERQKYLNEQIVVASTSGKLTILSEAGSGTLAGEAQKQAFDEIAQMIAADVAEVMQRQFDLPILQKAHPDEPVLAYFEFGAVDKDDTGEIVDDAVRLAGAGYAIDIEKLSEATGYALHERELVKPPPPPQQQPQPQPETRPRPPAVAAPGADEISPEEFIAEARLGAAQAADLGPLQTALAQALQGEADLADLRARLPEILREINQGDNSAEALYEILTGAIAEGLTDGHGG